MSENNFNTSNPETANHHWFPFLRYKKECEAAGKEASVNEQMRATGQLDAKIAHEESVALAAKIAAEKEADAKKAKEKGKIAGIHNGSVKYMKEMMDYGFQFTTLLSDFRMMTSHAESLLKELKDVDTKSDKTSAY